jgi:hypothetical protein
LEVFETPPPHALEARDLSEEGCRLAGVRWNPRDETWILPIHDIIGRLLGWQIKGTTSRLFRNFPTGVRKGDSLFGLSACEESEFVVVVESPLDAARLLSMDIPAVATYGASVSHSQVAMLSEFVMVISAFDNDEAGRQVTQRLWNTGINHRVMQYPDTIGIKDPGDMSREDLKRAIKNAPHYLAVKF